MFSASIVDAGSLKLWTQGLWCLSWRQPPNPVVDNGSNRCRQAEEGLLACGTPDAVDLTGTGRPGQMQAQSRTVLKEAKTRVWEEFGGEAMEEDYIGRPRRDSGKPSGASEGGSSTLPTLFTVRVGSC
ncbi:hypothetical protein L3Q82_002865 [Scortum barcoo]|uniref:Uncharacterized protein n=1 Tax=Scortum barcoo TaxID=214431 RepID=A0ACB8VUY2_9TELE|nr:hypothetical protein L3Q82_002865 [Scortum barcoo]